MKMSSLKSTAIKQIKHDVKQTVKDVYQQEDFSFAKLHWVDFFSLKSMYRFAVLMYHLIGAIFYYFFGWMLILICRQIQSISSSIGKNVLLRPICRNEVIVSEEWMKQVEIQHKTLKKLPLQVIREMEWTNIYTVLCAYMYSPCILCIVAVCLSLC